MFDVVTRAQGVRQGPVASRVALRPIALLGALFLLLFLGIAWYLSPLDPGVLALQFAFSPRAFGQIIHAWSPEHLARYRNHLPVDLVLLLVYGAFGYLLATRTSALSSLPPWARRLATGCMPLAAAFDAVEDVLHWWLTEVPRFGVPLLYVLSATSASVKWALLLVFGFAVIYAQAARRD